MCGLPHIRAANLHWPGSLHRNLVWSCMGKVTANMSMSLDGFIAGPNVSVKSSLGDGGEQLDVMVAGGANVD